MTIDYESDRNGFCWEITLRIYFVQLWKSRFFRSQEVGQPLKGMGLDVLESHRLKRPSGTDFELWKYHAIFQVNIVTLGKALLLLGLRVSHKMPAANFWSWRGRLDLLIRGLLAATKGFPHPMKIYTCSQWCRIIGWLVKSLANLSHWTSPTSAYHHLATSCCRISFSQAGMILNASSAPQSGGQILSWFWTSATGDIIFSLTSRDSSCITHITGSRVSKGLGARHIPILNTLCK